MSPTLRKALLRHAAACERAASAPDDTKARREAARAGSAVARARSASIRSAAGLPARAKRERGGTSKPRLVTGAGTGTATRRAPTVATGPIALMPPRPLRADTDSPEDRELFGRGAPRPIARRY
ncbi:hypothetical protein CAE01nite_12370 [Cellulomonas aerilata]|uniref:Uncharacterized protein n=1 Tax=Cellulomonas aerilata TaxID=515326 RepID=A0A512DAK8_9CELL|nr:hypothetical protein CAE01nite_12370 [Cellulomonas aerilata]